MLWLLRWLLLCNGRFSLSLVALSHPELVVTLPLTFHCLSLPFTAFHHVSQLFTVVPTDCCDRRVRRCSAQASSHRTRPSTSVATKSSPSCSCSGSGCCCCCRCSCSRSRSRSCACACACSCSPSCSFHSLLRLLFPLRLLLLCLLLLLLHLLHLLLLLLSLLPPLVAHSC